jgi:hypothetical protein
MNKRPITVTILACVLIATGAAELAFHLADFRTPHALPSELVWISLIRLVAIVSGAFMLRVSGWARWLALGWIGFHVAISFFNSWQQVALHGLIFALFAYLLLRPEARAYFRRRKAEAS